jgi:hypothetical protein
VNFSADSIDKNFRGRRDCLIARSWSSIQANCKDTILRSIGLERPSEREIVGRSEVGSTGNTVELRREKAEGQTKCRSDGLQTPR